MENQKIYLLAELIVGPEFLDEVKAIAKEALIPLCVLLDRRQLGHYSSEGYAD